MVLDFNSFNSHFSFNFTISQSQLNNSYLKEEKEAQKECPNANGGDLYAKIIYSTLVWPTNHLKLDHLLNPRSDL